MTFSYILQWFSRVFFLLYKATTYFESMTYFHVFSEWQCAAKTKNGVCVPHLPRTLRGRASSPCAHRPTSWCCSEGLKSAQPCLVGEVVEVLSRTRKQTPGAWWVHSSTQISSKSNMPQVTKRMKTNMLISIRRISQKDLANIPCLVPRRSLSAPSAWSGWAAGQPCQCPATLPTAPWWRVMTQGLRRIGARIKKDFAKSRVYSPMLHVSILGGSRYLHDSLMLYQFLKRSSSSMQLCSELQTVLGHPGIHAGIGRCVISLSGSPENGGRRGEAEEKIQALPLVASAQCL